MFRDLSIRRKLTVMATAISTLSLLAACGAFTGYELVSSRRDTAARLGALVDVITANAAAPLAFRDRAAAEELLGSLRDQDEITAAVLYTSRGAVFARRTRDPQPTVPPKPGVPGVSFGREAVEVVRDVVLDRERIGTLYVRADLSKTYLRVRRYAALAAIVLAGSFLLAFLLSARLQRIISEPVLRLEQTARTVSLHKDYTVRAIRHGRDEVGNLIDAFNEMLGQIETGRSELERHREHLEELVCARTAELVQMNVELTTARDAAQKSARLKSEFLANISHELRTPMNGVLGMTQLALDTELTPDQRDYLETSHQSAKGLLALLNDILDFSKIDAGKLRLEEVEFNFRETILAPIRTLSVAAREKGLRVQCETGDDVPEILVGDPYRLQQVMTNLVGNAVKFTAAGVIAVSAGVRGALPENVVLEIAVKDTGTGISPDKQRVIFDAFTQADGSTTRKFGGTGLGLSICSHLVSLMGGDIWVESEPGKGSTFRFTARFSAPATQRLRSDPEPHAFAEERPLHSLRVLLAEDHPVNQKLAVKLLTKKGHAVTVASNGLEAVLAVQQSRFDLVLMDIQMPEMDGIDATRAIRAWEAEAGIPATPIVALTAHAMNGHREGCLEAGMNDFLVKPFEPSDLQRLLDRHGSNSVDPHATKVG